MKEMIANNWYIVHVAISLFWFLLLVAWANVHRDDFYSDLPEKVTSDDDREKGWALILTVIISNLPIVRFFVFIAWVMEACG